MRGRDEGGGGEEETQQGEFRINRQGRKEEEGIRNQRG